MTPRRGGAVRIIATITIVVSALCIAGVLAIVATRGGDPPAGHESVAGAGELAYLAALRKLEPGYASASDVGLVDDGKNTCADLKAGEAESVVATRVRARYERPGVAKPSTARAAEIVSLLRKHLCPS